VKRFLAAIGLGLLIVVALAVVYLEVLRETAPTVVGSPTTEYVPQQSTPSLPPTDLAWPTYGFDAARDRAVAQTKLRPPFRRIWTFHGHSLLEFPPVVGYGKVFITNFNGRLYALSAATGKTMWSYSSGRCGWASPALADGLVVETFIGSSECQSRARNGEIAAFDAATGQLRWLRAVGPTESSPLIVDETIYLGDWNGKVWALALNGGRVRWTRQLSGAIKGSLATDGQRLFIGTYAGEMAALNKRGRVIWRSGGHGAFYSSPAVAYGRVFIGSLDDGVYAFGATTGHLLWSRPTGGYVYASPAISNHLVLIGSYSRRFYALAAATGLVRWSLNTNGPISGSASVIDGLVYFSTFNRRTYALEAASGREIATWPDGKYSPAVADSQHLYLVGLGQLYEMAPR
jgi:outer membrane protein assembly factor BamB